METDSVTACAQADVRVEAAVEVAGRPGGHYHARTIRTATGFTDEVDQLIVVDRLGSRVGISTRDVYVEDAEGRVMVQHSEISASRTTTVDVVAGAVARSLPPSSRSMTNSRRQR